MIIKTKLKPLYANLKRLKIGDYLFSKEFKLYTIEKDLDKEWAHCMTEVQRSKTILVMGYHNTENEEEAFLYLMSYIYDEYYDSFGDFITKVLINFAKWNKTKLDFTEVHHNLKEIGLTDKYLLDFTKESRKIRDSKNEKQSEEYSININNTIVKNESRKIFIVHGHDDQARLELSKILKDDLNLQPIILQDEPNVTIKTIITKFERLATECSAAIIIFTPDDNINGKLRARQNVILELGYFLGKFQDKQNRRIVILKRGDIEIPSDISGVLYLEYHKSMKEIFYDLKKQFETWGYN